MSVKVKAKSHFYHRRVNCCRITSVNQLNKYWSKYWRMFEIIAFDNPAQDNKDTHIEFMFDKEVEPMQCNSMHVILNEIDVSHIVYRFSFRSFCILIRFCRFHEYIHWWWDPQRVNESPSKWEQKRTWTTIEQTSH